MHNVLIVDFSIFKDALAKIFTDNNYNVTVCDSAYEAMTNLKSFDFDLVVSEVELPGDNSFDLYNYIRTNYPYIPLIMTTDKNIDTFFDRIFKEGIGNVLFKPLQKSELLNLSEKLITKKNIFGLTNYISDIIEIKKIRLTHSKQIKKGIDVLLSEIESWGFTIPNKMSLKLVLNEMTINAVYHSHGLTKEKEQRIPVTLPEGSSVDLFFCYSNEKFGIAIDDYCGKLTKMKILDSINKVIEQNQLILEAAETGADITDFISETGRGIDLVRKLTGEYCFIIKENMRTEIILIFDKDYTNDHSEHYTSLKIIEDIHQA
jgi:CheY-like chemotaxis protein/two-component sensor histidine kinase